MSVLPVRIMLVDKGMAGSGLTPSALLLELVEMRLVGANVEADAGANPVCVGEAGVSLRVWRGTAIGMAVAGVL